VTGVFSRLLRGATATVLDNFMQNGIDVFGHLFGVAANVQSLILY
jgi:predicted patatin/cPLA2 family phospholipase